VSKYRSKIVEIDAFQLGYEPWPEWFNEAHGSNTVVTRLDGYDSVHHRNRVRAEIYTLEGVMLAQYGDWIIYGPEGELYPCKDSVFRATYEPRYTVGIMKNISEHARKATEEIRALVIEDAPEHVECCWPWIGVSNIVQQIIDAATVDLREEIAELLAAADADAFIIRNLAAELAEARPEIAKQPCENRAPQELEIAPGLGGKDCGQCAPCKAKRES